MLPWVRGQQHVHAEASPCSCFTEGLRSVDFSLASPLSWHQRQLGHGPLLLLGAGLMPIIVRPLLITATQTKNCCVLLHNYHESYFVLFAMSANSLASCCGTNCQPSKDRPRPVLSLGGLQRLPHEAVCILLLHFLKQLSTIHLKLLCSKLQLLHIMSAAVGKQ